MRSHHVAHCTAAREPLERFPDLLNQGAYMTPRILNNPALDAKFQEAISGKENDVEIDLIFRTLVLSGGVDTERLVLEYGRPFTGVPRPKGYRQWARKLCFRNAQSLAERDQGHYCEGFVIAPGLDSAFLHGWITLDGTDAVDVTLPNGPEHKYFGISFGEPTLKRLMLEMTVKTGYWSPLLSPPIDPRVVDALKALRADGLL
jgi:hypothetical protein